MITIFEQKSDDESRLMVVSRRNVKVKAISGSCMDSRHTHVSVLHALKIENV